MRGTARRVGSHVILCSSALLLRLCSGAAVESGRRTSARAASDSAVAPHASNGARVSDETEFIDDATTGTRSWSRCNFQAIRNDPIDQFVFHLLGGHMKDWQRDFLNSNPGCDVWVAPNSKSHCPCVAPLSLIGTGTFVEIGANDGLHMSNSWFFEHHLRWNGMCVEANPQVFRRLQQNRPNCLNINSLISAKANRSALPFLSFYRKPGQEKKNTARDWETGLSGVRFARLNRRPCPVRALSSVWFAD